MVSNQPVRPSVPSRSVICGGAAVSQLALHFCFSAIPAGGFWADLVRYAVLEQSPIRDSRRTAAFNFGECVLPTQCCRSILQRFKGRYPSGAGARRAYSRTAGRPFWPFTFFKKATHRLKVRSGALSDSTMSYFPQGLWFHSCGVFQTKNYPAFLFLE